MSTILVAGTCAIDYIGRYGRSFSTLPTPQALNLSMQLQGLRKGYGGCAMNIAVTLHRLGHHALPFADIGGEFDADYQAHLDSIGIDQRGLTQSTSSSLASHALILTDTEENQFTAFYPGEPKPTYSEDLAALIDSLETKIDCVFLAPDEPEYMLAAAEVCLAKELDFLCDPGQCTSAFSAEDCKRLVSLASTICFNRYEHEIFESHVENLDDELEVVIVTQGSDGVRMKVDGAWIQERAARPIQHQDPTGCGDAFRAGLLHARQLGASWRDALRAGCTMATINLEHLGTQLHDFADFQTRYCAEWSNTPNWFGSA